MVESPANLPDELAAEPGYGAVQTVIFALIYAALIVFAIIYLVRKLPRGVDIGSPPDAGADDEEAD
ncbi:MAG: hypothetical protein ACYTFZ_09760 [Planctomycetota bacterium]|jgi:hypothetical protein